MRVAVGVAVGLGVGVVASALHALMPACTAAYAFATIDVATRPLSDPYTVPVERIALRVWSTVRLPLHID